MKKSAQNQKIVKISLPSYIAEGELVFLTRFQFLESPKVSYQGRAFGWWMERADENLARCHKYVRICSGENPAANKMKS